MPRRTRKMLPWCAALIICATVTTALTAADAPSQPLRVVFFHSLTCEQCQKVKPVLAASEVKWAGRISVQHRDVAHDDAHRDMLLYGKYYGNMRGGPPMIYVGRSYLTAPDKISTELDAVIARELRAGSTTFDPSETPTKPASQEAAELLDSLGIVAVALAGLADGINPCAFTTIVFLLSMLAYMGRSRRDLAVVGVGFTAAIFATYLLLGFGLMTAVKIFSVEHGISRGLAIGVGVAALALSAWSFLDFVRVVRSKNPSAATLGLPRSVTARIHRVIRSGLTTRSLLIGSVVVGVLVALLESICTGQVYLPTIMFIVRRPGPRAAGAAYLLLYNLMFIAPLVGILILAWLGVGSERLGGFLRRNLALLKLVMAMVFLGLGIMVLTTL